ncbi:hypothetical protein JCM10213v2_008329 [Rhodosporidiobolus nylandii]
MPTYHPPGVHPLQPRGVRWRRDWLGATLATFSILLLVGWLVAAIVLWQNKTSVPVNWFAGLGGQENGITNGTYNTLVAFAGSLTAALVSYGIASGWKAILRRRMLRPHGLSLYHYDALVSYANSTIQFELRWSAVWALALFAFAQLLTPATQAAFGSSVVAQNLSAPFPLTRVSDNAAVLAPYLPIIASALPQSSDIDNNVYALGSPNSSYVAATIDGIYQQSRDDLPAYSLFWQKNIAFTAGEQAGGPQRNTTGTSNATISPFSSNQERFLSASGKTVVHTPVEGFYATSNCSLFSPPYTSFQNATLERVLYTLAFPCGTRTVDYLTSAFSAVDTYACQDGTQSVYIIAPDVATGSLAYAYECPLTSLRSAVVPVMYQPQLSAAKVVCPPVNTTDIPTSLGAVAFLGRDVLNDQGSSGWARLSKTAAIYSEAGGDLRVFYSAVVASLARTELARASMIATFTSLLSPPPFAVRNSTIVMNYEVQALQIHLSGASLGWLVVPFLLLALLLLTSLFLIRDSGPTDFTDPVSVALIGLNSPADPAVALIGLNSPADPAVAGSCTGEFADSARDVRVAYGEPVSGPTAGQQHLEMTASPGVGRMGRPRKGVEYA